MIRLRRCSPVWALLFAVVITSICDEADAVIGDVEYDTFISNFVPKVNHLDVWVGVSSFSDGFRRQSHVTVAESAWIEYSTFFLFKCLHSELLKSVN